MVPAPSDRVAHRMTDGTGERLYRVAVSLTGATVTGLTNYTLTWSTSYGKM